MANVLPGENRRLFAGDADLFISGVKFIMLSDNCNYCIDALNEWFTVNDT